MIANICYNSTEPNIGLKLNMDRMTLKCYMEIPDCLSAMPLMKMDWSARKSIKAAVR